MVQMVQFGMNQFRKPNGFVFGKSHDIAKWRNQVRERIEKHRMESPAGLSVNGQELTPQHQKQQLTTKVESAKRRELVQIYNKIFPETLVRLEHVIDVSETLHRSASGNTSPVARGPQVAEQELREKSKAVILLADAKQLKAIGVVVNSVIRGPEKDDATDVARPVIDRVNYASRDEVVAMRRVLVTATKAKETLLDSTGSIPKGNPEGQLKVEEAVRGSLRIALQGLRTKPEIMAKLCAEMMSAADKAAPSYQQTPGRVS